MTDKITVSPDDNAQVVDPRQLQAVVQFLIDAVSGKPMLPKGTDGAAHVALSDAVPTYRTAVDPEISGVVTPEISVDAAGSGFVYFVRATVNPGDDVTGATRLLNGYPSIHWALPGETISIRFSVPVTDLYLIGVISGTTYTSTAYGIGLAETDLADAQAEMAHFTFDEAHKVREVVITVSPTFTSGQLCRVKVEGVRHA